LGSHELGVLHLRLKHGAWWFTTWDGPRNDIYSLPCCSIQQLCGDVPVRWPLQNGCGNGASNRRRFRVLPPVRVNGYVCGKLPPSPHLTGIFSSAEVSWGVSQEWLGNRHPGKEDATLQGNKRDRRVATRSHWPSRAQSDGAGGTLRGPPA
jgi:hypothetical protein